MNAQKKLSLLLISLLVFACSTGDDPEPVEQVYVPKSEINSLENIPGLEKALLRYTMGGHSTENQLSINEDAVGYLSKVDFESIHSRMDSTGQTYYSMYMDLNSEDPFTFYNLVIGKRPDGEFAPPMLMTYQMSEGFKEKYLETGSLEGFEGSITRAYISQDGIGTNMRAEANLLGGVKSGTTVPVECGDDVPIKPNPPKEPVNDRGTNTGGTSSQGSSGGTSYETGCTYKIVQVYHESSFYNARTGTYQQGEGYWTTTTVLECPNNYNEYSSSDTDCPDPDDGEVPVIDKAPLRIIRDTSFKNTKAECVLDKLNSSSQGFKKMIQKFDGDFPVAHLRFKTGITQGRSAAITMVPNNTLTSDKYIIDIIFNSDVNSQGHYNFRPSLLSAKDLAHEVIHAEMYRKLMSLAKEGRLDFSGWSTDRQKSLIVSLKNDFPGIYDYMRRYKNWQHEQMAAHYRSTLVDIMKSFGGNTWSDKVYEDLSWEGLKGTVSWSSLSPSEQTRITNVIKSYIKQNKNDLCW